MSLHGHPKGEYRNAKHEGCLMSPYLRVVLHGFNDFEQRALGTVLRLGGSRAGRYVQVCELADADLIVGNADVPAVVAAITAAAREADAVFIGSRPPEGALTCLRRPIAAMQVLRELDGLREQHLERCAVATPAGRAPQSTAQAAQAEPAAAPAATAGATTAAAAVDATAAAAGVTALVVDDNPVAASALQLRLQQLGLGAEVADNHPHALELLAHKAFTWVFLGVELGEASGLDGLALCRHIKRWHLHADAPPPEVVVVSAHLSPLDRVRSTFAGGDHCLAKPVDDDTLRQLLLPPQLRPDARARRRWAVVPPLVTPSRS